MHTSKRMRGTLVALMAVVGSMLAVGAAPAMASLHWSDTTKGIKVSGSVQVTKSGSTKTCTVSANQENSIFAPASAYLQTTGSVVGDLESSCSGGGVFGIYSWLEAKSTTSVLVGAEYPYGLSPWSPWPATFTQQAVTADFTNGSGATASKLTFANDQVTAPGQTAITVSGSLNVTNSAGGLLTLQN